MNAEKLTAPTPPVGVIESLTIGFETVAGRLVLILLPLLLDMFLWVGPRLSLRPAIASYYQDFWQPAMTSLDEAAQERLAGVSEMLLEAAEEMPALYLPLLGVPSLMAGREAAPLPFHYTPPVWEVRHPWGLVGVNVASLVVGLLLGALYIALIANQVQLGRIDLGQVLSRLPVNVAWIAIFGLTVPILLVVIYLPFVALAAGLSLISSLLAVLADWAGRLLVLWIALFLVFTVHGLFMNNRSLPGALWDSIRVVQWNITSTLFLILLSVVLNLALTYVWNMAPAGSWLAVLAIVGNSFIATGLITASFVFFKDRYRYWHEMRAELIAELERRRAQQGQ